MGLNKIPKEKQNSIFFDLTLILLICSFKLLYSQIQKEVILIPGNSINSNVIVDSQNKIHLTWNEGYKIWYGVFDSTGKNIKKFMFPYSYEFFTESTLALRESSLVAVWISPTQSFNDYVVGQILPVNADSAKKTNLLFNGSYMDALRGLPKICFLNDTTFIVTWWGDGPQTDRGIYGQIVTIAGVKIGDVIFFGDHGTFFEGVEYGPPKVVSYPNSSEFIIFWRDNHTGKQQVYGRIFNGDGTAKGPSFPISNDVISDDIWTLSACMDSSGNFGVAWGTQIDSSLLDSTWQIKMRWFNSDAQPLGSSKTVESNSVAGFPELSMATDKDGKGVVVWESGGYPDPTKIYGRRFSKEKNIVGNSFKISDSNDSTRETYPAVKIKNDNIYSVWNSNAGIKYKLIDFNNPPTDIKEIYRNNPNSFFLFQNFPNPFNPSTNIEFQIKNSGFITLRIFNILGREVKTLISRELNPGIYNLNWEGDDETGKEIGSGIYFYRLSVSGQSKTKKMLLIR